MRVSGFNIFLACVTVLLSIAAPGNGQTINCTCRYQGVSYNLNTCVCINRGDGPQLACCGMVLNNTSWSFTKEACPVVLVPQTDMRQSAVLSYTPIPSTKPMEDLQNLSSRK